MSSFQAFKAKLEERIVLARQKAKRNERQIVDIMLDCIDDEETEIKSMNATITQLEIILQKTEQLIDTQTRLIAANIPQDLVPQRAELENVVKQAEKQFSLFESDKVAVEKVAENLCESNENWPKLYRAMEKVPASQENLEFQATLIQKLAEKNRDLQSLVMDVLSMQLGS